MLKGLRKTYESIPVEDEVLPTAMTALPKSDGLITRATSAPGCALSKNRSRPIAEQKRIEHRQFFRAVYQSDATFLNPFRSLSPATRWPRENKMENSGSGDLVPVAWSYPVQVKISYGSSEYIHNSTQALDCLLNRWPADSGMYFETAKIKCDGAIKRIIGGEDARDSFISAAIDAHVLAY
jgi:hypothetical protein